MPLLIDHSSLSVKTLCTEYVERIIVIASAFDENAGVRYHVENTVNRAVASLTASGVKSPVDNLRILKAQLALAEHGPAGKKPKVAALLKHARMLVGQRIEQLTGNR